MSFKRLAPNSLIVNRILMGKLTYYQVATKDEIFFYIPKGHDLMTYCRAKSIKYNFSFFTYTVTLVAIFAKITSYLGACQKTVFYSLHPGIHPVCRLIREILSNGTPELLPVLPILPFCILFGMMTSRVPMRSVIPIMACVRS